jgi:cysteine desulfurase / selenocysteine lyase
MENSNHKNGYKKYFNNLEIEVPLLNGLTTQYVNFDNAASTPPMAITQEVMEKFLPYYSSVHRGTGYKSQLSTHIYEEARELVLKFVGADANEHTCAFVKNTTEAINKMARRFPFTEERNVVITTAMEHHSNDLPWRENAVVVHIKTLEDGQLDLNDFDKKLDEYSDSVAIVSVTGGSNVTGFINPIHDLAEKAHAVGAHFMADCAQLAPHRKVEMLPLDDPRHLDYLCLSAHKLYAPFGSGALIGRIDTFEKGKPDMVGGGVVNAVTLDKAYWAGLPDREEAGSPNHVGAILFASAIKQLMEIGMERVANHEAELSKYTLEKLLEISGIEIYGDLDPKNTKNRLGVIPFNIVGMNHFLVAAILGHEFGIGVRNGCFCAHPLIMHLLKIEGEEADEVIEAVVKGEGGKKPGLIRASFGLYNTTDEIDKFVEALQKIVAGKYQGNYIQQKNSGEFIPEGWNPEFDRAFKL